MALSTQDPQRAYNKFMAIETKQAQTNLDKIEQCSRIARNLSVAIPFLVGSLYSFVIYLSKDINAVSIVSGSLQIQLEKETALLLLFLGLLCLGTLIMWLSSVSTLINPSYAVLAPTSYAKNFPFKITKLGSKLIYTSLLLVTFLVLSFAFYSVITGGS